MSGPLNRWIPLVGGIASIGLAFVLAGPGSPATDPAGATVAGEVLEQTRSKKTISFVKRRRQNAQMRAAA